VILRTTPQNLAELRMVLESIDGKLRRLQVSVKQASRTGGRDAKASVSGSVGNERKRVTVPDSGSGEGGRVEIRRDDDRVRAHAQASQSSAVDLGVQTVQVLEGNDAYIRVGQSIPVRSGIVTRTPQGAQISESVDYHDADTGFYVKPRVSGEQVTLSIGTRRDSVADPNSGSINVQRMDTIVSGRLGEWIELGGIMQDSTRTDGGTIYRRSSVGFDDRRVFLKVEEIP
jgi:type II secretory pathway component GspD/PulD (secretin)